MERQTNINEQVGYLTGLLENYIKNNEEWRSGAAKFRETQDSRLDKQDEILAKIVAELSMYKTIIKTIKFLAASAVALLTFKWALLIDLWQHFRTG